MRLPRLPLVTAAVLLAAATAFAVRPQAWTRHTEQDFTDGTFDNTVINSYGELTLGRELKSISLGEPVEMITGAAAGADGAMYVATTPDSKVFRVAGNKAAAWYEGQGTLTALAADAKGDLLAAVTDGKNAKLLRLPAGEAKPKPATVFERPGVEHIWAIASRGDALYVGTGPKGHVYKIAPDGAADLALDTGGRNVISLAFDKKGRLIAGTDGQGLIVRREDAGKAFVLHDAGKVDITALVFDDAGNLYASAARSESDFGFDFPDDGPGTRSKPGKLEPEPFDDEGPDPMPEKPKTKPSPKKSDKAPSVQPADGPTGAAALPPGVHAQQKPSTFEDQLRDQLKALAPRTLKEKDGPPSTRKKPPTTGKLGSGTSRHKSLRRTPRFDDFEPEPTNAVYRIAPDGAVSTLLSGDNMHMSLLFAGGELLIGTGTEGKIFSYKPEDESQALVARVKEDSVTALALGKDGTVFVGASDLGALYTLSATLAPTGTFTSKTLDATRTADWGTLTATTSMPKGVVLATRTGNTRDVEKSDRFWSEFAPVSDGGISSPKARYIQYRVTLRGDAKTATPTVSDLRLSYQVPNLPPRIKNLVVDTGSFFDRDHDFPPVSDSSSGPSPIDISWDASDPNRDTLSYHLYTKPSDGDAWTLIAKDLKDETYEWNARTLADGKYQVKVVATDSPDNPPGDAKAAARVSAPFIIDHTGPVLGEVKADVADGKVTLAGTVKDALSPVVDVRFQIDAQQDWQPATASDKIFDSLSEAFSATTRALPAGTRRITVRATDAAGNASYKALTVSVPAK